MDVLDTPDLPSDSNKTARTIDDVLRDGYQFNFGEYLSRMFALFGKTWGNLLGHGAIMMATYFVLYIIAIIVMFGFLADTVLSTVNENGEPDPSQIMTSMLGMMAVYLIAILLYMCLWVFPFRAGIYTHLEDGVRTGQFQFNTFFRALKRKWLKLVALTIIIFILSWALGLVGYVMWLDKFINNMSTLTQDPEVIRSNPFMMYEGLSTVLYAYLPGIFFSIICSLAWPLLLFQTDSVIHALASSMKIVIRKWFHFFGLYILVYLLSMIGIVACGIGLLLTMQFFPIVIYVIYEDIFIHQSRNETTQVN